MPNPNQQFNPAQFAQPQTSKSPIKKQQGNVTYVDFSQKQQSQQPRKNIFSNQQPSQTSSPRQTPPTQNKPASTFNNLAPRTLSPTQPLHTHTTKNTQVLYSQNKQLAQLRTQEIEKRAAIRKSDIQTRNIEAQLAGQGSGSGKNNIQAKINEENRRHEKAVSQIRNEKSQAISKANSRMNLLKKRTLRTVRAQTSDTRQAESQAKSGKEQADRDAKAMIEQRKKQVRDNLNQNISTLEKSTSDQINNLKRAKSPQSMISQLETNKNQQKQALQSKAQQEERQLNTELQSLLRQNEQKLQADLQQIKASAESQRLSLGESMVLLKDTPTARDFRRKPHGTKQKIRNTALSGENREELEQIKHLAEDKEQMETENHERIIDQLKSMLGSGGTEQILKEQLETMKKQKQALVEQLREIMDQINNIQNQKAGVGVSKAVKPAFTPAGQFIANAPDIAA